MSFEADASEDFSRIVDSTGSFEDVVSEYGGEKACFDELRPTAKESADSFEEYLTFYRRFVEAGSSTHATRYLQRNGVRMLKNMVLRSSDAGRRYPIRSLDELHRRVTAIQELGVERVAAMNVIWATYEEVYDSDQNLSWMHEVADRLLQSGDDSPIEAKELLVRIRFVSVTHGLDIDSGSFQQYVAELQRGVSQERIVEETSSDEILAAADALPPKDPDKPLKYWTAVIAADQPDLKTIEEWLYYSARDVIERSRHAEGSDPTRGELQLALWQFNVLLSVFEEQLNSKRAQRVKSYQQLALGFLRSGRKWNSQKDPEILPEPSFLEASQFFLRGSFAIASVDTERQVKHLSRAFRNLANAAHGPLYSHDLTQEWQLTQQIHETAIGVVNRIRQLDIEDESLRETINETVALHLFEHSQAGALAALHAGNIERIATDLEHAEEQRQKAPVVFSEDAINDIRITVNAIRAERDADFETALLEYDRVESPHINVQDRVQLATLKQYLDEGEYENALEFAQQTGPRHTAIQGAIHVLAGESYSFPNEMPRVAHDLMGVDIQKLWRLAFLVHMMGNQSQESPPALQDELETAVMNL